MSEANPKYITPDTEIEFLDHRPSLLSSHTFRVGHQRRCGARELTGHSSVVEGNIGLGAKGIGGSEEGRRNHCGGLHLAVAFV
jgi:hypothetical protein